jgi:hypothetical protein
MRKSYKHHQARTVARFVMIETRTNLGKATATSVFGIPLHISIQYANIAVAKLNAAGQHHIMGYIPIVVAKTGSFLKEEGKFDQRDKIRERSSTNADKATGVEEIFAIGGSPLHIQELQRVFDSPERYGKGFDWTGYTVHDAADILLRYLLQLPISVIPLVYYERFRSPLRGHQAVAVGVKGHQLPSSDCKPDRNATLQIYQSLIAEMPPFNRQILLYLLDLLSVFASKSELNNMTIPKLAAIFQPGILSHPEHGSSIREAQLSQDVLHLLIEEQESLSIDTASNAASHQPVGKAPNANSTAPPIMPPRSQAAFTTLSPSTSNAAQDIHFGVSGSDVEVKGSQSANKLGAAGRSDTDEHETGAASPTNHLGWVPEQLPDIII